MGKADDNIRFGLKLIDLCLSAGVHILAGKEHKSLDKSRVGLCHGLGCLQSEQTDPYAGFCGIYRIGLNSLKDLSVLKDIGT